MDSTPSRRHLIPTLLSYAVRCALDSALPPDEAWVYATHADRAAMEWLMRLRQMGGSAEVIAAGSAA